MTNDLVRGRQVIAVLTNQTGGAVVEGDTVIVDTGNDEAFDSTVVEGQTAECVGVVLEDIANAAQGRVCIGGYVQLVTLDGAANIGDWIKTDGVALQATPQAAPGSGCFGQALEAGAAPSAVIGKIPLQTLIHVHTGIGEGGTISPYPPSLFYGSNLIKNSPGQIVVDGAEPQWWDEVANATITDEDAAGEACSDLFERVFKVVTIADDVYGYQTLTFADEQLLDAGATVVSLSIWVWCAAAIVASIGIYGTNLGLQESPQHTGGSGWELLVVENITLDAADATIQVRLICDTGTAFFAAPMLNVGPRALRYVARDTIFVPAASVQIFDLNTTGDVAWSDTDCTAASDPLAWMFSLYTFITEPDGAALSTLDIGHNDTILGADVRVMRNVVHIINQFFYKDTPPIISDDQQVIRYMVNEVDVDNDVRAYASVVGYWKWA